MSNVTPDLLLKFGYGHIYTKNLAAGVELGLFEVLAETPMTLEELSQRLKLKPLATRVLVSALTAIGFLEQDGDRYRNGAEAQTFLSGQGPADLRSAIRYWDRISYPNWLNYQKVLETGESLDTYDKFTDEQSEIYRICVEAFTIASAMALSDTYDFSRHKRILDIGGGTGSFLKVLLQHHPELQATLFELPKTARSAGKLLSEAGLADQINIVEGDFFKDALPGGHDLLMLNNILHNFSPEDGQRILEVVRQAADRGATLLIVDFWTNPDHTEPYFAALYSGEFYVNSGGASYSADEIKDWLGKHQWSWKDHRPLGGPSSVVIAEAA